MKKLFLIGLILMLAVPGIAALTTQEETEIKELLAKKQAILDIANTVNLEKIPIQLVQLRAERQALIDERDGKIVDEKNKMQDAIQILMDNYKVLTDVKEAEIIALQNQLTP